MTAAIAIPCLLCGLEFTSAPLLVQHIREDHVCAHAWRQKSAYPGIREPPRSQAQ